MARNLLIIKVVIETKDNFDCNTKSARIPAPDLQRYEDVTEHVLKSKINPKWDHVVIWSTKGAFARMATPHRTPNNKKMKRSTGSTDKLHIVCSHCYLYLEYYHWNDTETKKPLNEITTHLKRFHKNLLQTPTYSTSFVRMALHMMIMKCGLSANLLQNDDFRAFLKLSFPMTTLPSRHLNHSATLIISFIKDKIVREVAGKKLVMIQDTWSPKNLPLALARSHLPFVVAYFDDNDVYLVHKYVLLAFKSVSKSTKKDADWIKGQWLSVMSDYKLSQCSTSADDFKKPFLTPIVAMSADGAAPNVSMANKSNMMMVVCMAHALNTIIQPCFLKATAFSGNFGMIFRQVYKAIKSVCKKIKNHKLGSLYYAKYAAKDASELVTTGTDALVPDLTQYTMDSSETQVDPGQSQSSQAPPKENRKVLTIDQETRWNSIGLMYERVLLHATSINKFLDESETMFSLNLDSMFSLTKTEHAALVNDWKALKSKVMWREGKDYFGTALRDEEFLPRINQVFKLFLYFTNRATTSQFPTFPEYELIFQALELTLDTTRSLRCNATVVEGSAKELRSCLNTFLTLLHTRTEAKRDKIYKSAEGYDIVPQQPSFRSHQLRHFCYAAMCLFKATYRNTPQCYPFLDTTMYNSPFGDDEQWVVMAEILLQHHTIEQIAKTFCCTKTWDQVIVPTSAQSIQVSQPDTVMDSFMENISQGSFARVASLNEMRPELQLTPWCESPTEMVKCIATRLKEEVELLPSWRQRQNLKGDQFYNYAFPPGTLVRLVASLLYLPTASSIKCESLFSITGNLIHARENVKEDNFSNQVMILMNKGLVSYSDIPTVMAPNKEKTGSTQSTRQ